MSTYSKPINYPYAYGYFTAGISSVTFKVYQKAIDMGISSNQAYELEKFMEEQIKELEATTHEKAAAEYEAWGDNPSN